MLRGVNVIFEKSDAIQIRVFFIRGESQNQGIVTPSVFYFTGCQIDPHVMTGTHPAVISLGDRNAARKNIDPVLVQNLSLIARSDNSDATQKWLCKIATIN